MHFQKYLQKEHLCEIVSLLFQKLKLFLTNKFGDPQKGTFLNFEIFFFVIVLKTIDAKM